MPSEEITWAYRGPDLKEGFAKTFIYFTLSKEESLNLSPINAPVEYLIKKNVRCISFDIPFHKPGIEPNKTMKMLKEACIKDASFLELFLNQIKEKIISFIDQGICHKDKIALGGISRGAFIALQLSKRLALPLPLVGFSPLTHLEALEEFQQLKQIPHLIPFSKKSTIEKLLGKPLCFYIGNNDRRVFTDEVYQFQKELVELSLKHNIRAPEVETHIFPSVGHKGHGTPENIFIQGASWIDSKLL